MAKKRNHLIIHQHADPSIGKKRIARFEGTERSVARACVGYFQMMLWCPRHSTPSSPKSLNVDNKNSLWLFILIRRFGRGVFESIAKHFANDSLGTVIFSNFILSIQPNIWGKLSFRSRCLLFLDEIIW